MKLSCTKASSLELLEDKISLSQNSSSVEMFDGKAKTYWMQDRQKGNMTERVKAS